MKILLLALSIPAIIFSMGDNKQLTIVKNLKEAERFKGRVVIYKPRLMLGESVSDPQNSAQVNFGFIDSEVEYFPEISPENAFLTLYTLKYWRGDVITRVLSDKTLAQESLKLRLANVTDIDNLNYYLSKGYEFQFCNKTESYTLYSRLRNAEAAMHSHFELIKEGK